MASRPRTDITYVTLVAEDGTVYEAGTDVASSVQIMGDALTALEASATDLAAIEVLLTDLNTAIGTAADAAGDPTVIGLLKQIMANTTP